MNVRREGSWQSHRTQPPSGARVCWSDRGSWTRPFAENRLWESEHVGGGGGATKKKVCPPRGLQPQEDVHPLWAAAGWELVVVSQGCWGALWEEQHLWRR